MAGLSSDQPETLPGLPGLVVKQRIQISNAQVTKLVTPLHKVVTGLGGDQDLPVWLASWLARTADCFVFCVKHNGRPIETHTAIPFDSHCTVEVGKFMFTIVPVRRGPLKDPIFLFSRKLMRRVDKELSQRMTACKSGKHPSDSEFFELMSESAGRSAKKRKAE